MLADHVCINLRYYKWSRWLHTKSVSVVDSYCSMTHGMWGKLFTYISTCTKQCDVNAFKAVRTSFLNGNFLSLETKNGSC
ncbi:hypothetical protein D3C81_1955800 [compost metagenome]